MRSLFTQTLQCIALCFVLLTASCSSPFGRADLVGRWQVAEFDTDINRLSPALLQAGEDEALSTQYVLEADGTFEATSNFMPNGQKGAWAFNEESKRLTFVYMDTPDDSESYTVESANGSQSVWLMGMEGLGIMQFTLARQ